MHPAATLEEAAAVREAERRRFHDATHHVVAALMADGATRFDDDGEPTGSGGRPLLAELESRGIVDAVVVVTRYFGGTKLGTGGLARAYGASAALALEAGRYRSVVPGEIRRVRYGFDDTGVVARIIAAVGAQRGPDAFGAGDVRTEVSIARGTGIDLDRRLRDATSGRAGLEPDDDPPACWIASET